MRVSRLFAFFVAPLLIAGAYAAAETNLVADGSFEQPMPANRFGHVFKQWGGWKYEGDCEFRVGQVAHSGKTSCLLYASSNPKIRVAQTLKGLEPGRYKITAFIRGMDIGQGQYHANTEFMFNEQYFGLKKAGTFGWTPVTFVAEVKTKKDVTISFGLMAAGSFWIDDVSVARVGDDAATTAAPVVGKEEAPIAPPGELSKDFVRCPECGTKNNPEWGHCYVCGAAIHGKAVASGPSTKLITSFEGKNSVEGGKIVTEHATDGTHALLVDKGYMAINTPQDWSGYDYLKVDLYADADKPVTLGVEIQDQQTRGYWTRVNYSTLVPPGKSTFVLPLQQLYVGEKARPGRNLMLDAITRFVLNTGGAPVYFDNLRLERDTDTQSKIFDGLYAFSLGPKNGPLMPGFTRIDAATTYNKARGYGLSHAYVWRAVDSLQPEPLYENCLCIQSGGLAVDLPNGRYHVFVNIDNPSLFWGEYQTYRDRKVLAQGKVVVHETMDFESLKAKYYRHWDTEDLPTNDTFDKYQRTYFHEKEFDVDVANGQLMLGFEGDTGWACSVSAVVIYPEAKAAQGKAFLDYTVQKRRFFFDNYFHRILHKPTGDALAPSAAETQRGYVVFNRDTMEDVNCNDTPRKNEIDQPLRAAAFQGQYEPVAVALYPLIDLGKTTAAISDLSGPAVIPARDISVGYVSYRITRVAADGTVYTIEPRYIMPRDTVAIGKDITRRFWFTVHVRADARPGIYKGQVTLTPEHGQKASVPVEFEVYPGTLDPVDVPAGPFSYEIHAPWDWKDPAARAFNSAMDERCLRKMHDYGFTTFSGMPYVHYLGFKEGKPTFDFSTADRQMKLARDCGFTMPVITYCGFGGLDLYHTDKAAMKAAGFDDYTKFIKVVFTAIQAHADASNWLPVYWYLCDEPVGEDVEKEAENAECYHAAFGSGPPFFTGATSVDSADQSNPHLRLARALTAPSLNGHSEAAIRAIQKAGSGWAFYNGGNRWTYGIYMFKAVKQFDMKFRLTWHWNAAAGDPYYALDCREDDYAWCSGSPSGELIPSVRFERDMRGGIDDYRCMLTLARLAKEKHDPAAQKLINDRLASFKLGQRDHDKLFPIEDWAEFRAKMAKEIVRLRS